MTSQMVADLLGTTGLNWVAGSFSMYLLRSDGWPVTITGATLADPCVLTTSGVHGLVADDEFIALRHTAPASSIGTFRVLSAPTTTTLTLEAYGFEGETIDTGAESAFAGTGYIIPLTGTLTTSDLPASSTYKEGPIALGGKSASVRAIKATSPVVFPTVADSGGEKWDVVAIAETGGSLRILYYIVRGSDGLIFGVSSNGANINVTLNASIYGIHSIG